MEHLVPAKSLVTRRSHSFPHREQPGRKQSRALISPRTRPTPLVALAVLVRLLSNVYAVVTSWVSSPHPPSWITSLLCTFKKLSWVNGNSGRPPRTKSTRTACVPNWTFCSFRLNCCSERNSQSPPLSCFALQREPIEFTETSPAFPEAQAGSATRGMLPKLCPFSSSFSLKNWYSGSANEMT